jgi:hypothetical protein
VAHASALLFSLWLPHTSLAVLRSLKRCSHARAKPAGSAVAAGQASDIVLLCSCGIQSRRKVATLPEILELNANAAERGAKDDRSAWLHFGQERDYLYPLERVCGTEKDIAAMKANNAVSLAHIFVLAWTVLMAAALM